MKINDAEKASRLLERYEMATIALTQEERFKADLLILELVDPQDLQKAFIEVVKDNIDAQLLWEDERTHPIHDDVVTKFFTVGVETAKLVDWLDADIEIQLKAAETTILAQRPKVEQVESEFETPKPTRYKLRAERTLDVIRFLYKVHQTGQYLLSTSIEESTQVGCQASFDTYASIATLKRILAEDEDWSVMRATFAKESEYVPENFVESAAATA